MSGVHVSKSGPIATIALDNPPVNAISSAVLDGLEAALDEAARDRGVRALVLIGSDQIFAAGADIPSFLAAGLTPEQAIRRGVEVFNQVAALAKPVVVGVLGHCLGGGMELALAGDLRVADPDARFGQPEVHLGIIPGWNGTMRLPRLIGQSAAAEIILSGSPIDGRRAHALGLVNRLVRSGEVWATADNLARELAAQSPAALAHAKALLQRWPELDAPDREREAALELMAGPDAAEGLTAFMERRRPRFVTGAE